MIVPLPAGSPNDTSTRLIAQGLGPILGQTVIIENKAGASGVIGTSEVIRSKPDGLTILAGALSPLAANMAFVKDLPYDPRKDLVAVGASTLTNHVLVVSGSSPIKSSANNVVAEVEIIAKDDIDVAYRRLSTRDVRYRFVIDTKTI